MSVFSPDDDSSIGGCPIFASSTDDVCSLASTLAVPGLLPRVQKSPSRRLSAQAMFSSLRVTANAARPALASLFERAPSPQPAPLGHALPPLPDFGALDVAVPDAPSALPDVPPPSLEQIRAAFDGPAMATRSPPSVASASSDSESVYSDDAHSEPSEPSVETPNTSLSHLTSAASSPKRSFLLHRPILEHVPEPEPESEPERGRKRSDVSTLRHVASQAFIRQPRAGLKLPARSRSVAPHPSPNLLRVPSTTPPRGYLSRAASPAPPAPGIFASRPASPNPSRFLRAASPLPSARAALNNLGFLSSARSSQASLGTNAGVPRSQTSSVRRMFARSRGADGSRFSDDEEDFEMLSPPRDAGWRGMELYGGAGGQGKPTTPSKTPSKRTVLIVRLDSGNNFDLGLGAFESVRKWCSSYGSVSSIQVDNRRALPAVSLAKSLNLNLKRRVDSALRIEFRDKAAYEAACPGGIGSTCAVEMRGVGRVLLELAEQK
ncbi:hypothetical protein EXIGLDRAFT_765533 [Exidia glandulosa HHB12029]|uniref:Uncharacterized protein n=1 Tax=Exidia glandulosa HHB12029 TaxID=1314781 RepID=A0A165KD07_EXIGL|nr:hypothetical protein EXIGLDRAFT_765533 [Exidia glandulosa HHB12029]